MKLSETANLPDAVAEFNEIIQRAEILLSIARAGELQRAACEELERQAVTLKAEKSKAAAQGDEFLANILLGCECVNTAILSELRMWLALKEGRPHEAWDYLITAQEGAIAATRANEGFAHLHHHYERLEAIEKLVFPPQVFLSSGFIVESQECSICGGEYGDCEHLIGMPYMGRFCQVIARGVSVDHVSIVESPADKRCRIETFGVAGGKRDRMTWAITPDTKED